MKRRALSVVLCLSRFGFATLTPPSIIVLINAIEDYP